MVNALLLWKVLDHVEKNPHELAQHVWRCETGACFAGHTALLSGAEWVQPYEHPAYFDNELPAHVRRPGTTGESVHAADWAAEALQLSDEQADQLFYDLNTLADLRVIVEELTAGEVE